MTSRDEPARTRYREKARKARRELDAMASDTQQQVWAGVLWGARTGRRLADELYLAFVDLMARAEQRAGRAVRAG
jgi:hypothetical protein